MHRPDHIHGVAQSVKEDLLGLWEGPPSKEQVSLLAIPVGRSPKLGDTLYRFFKTPIQGGRVCFWHNAVKFPFSSPHITRIQSSVPKSCLYGAPICTICSSVVDVASLGSHEGRPPRASQMPRTLRSLEKGLSFDHATRAVPGQDVAHSERPASATEDCGAYTRVLSFGPCTDAR